MESALRSLTKAPSPFPKPPAAANHQPPLLPLPAQAPSPQRSFWPASRRPAPPPGPSAPITVAAPPSKRKVAPAPAPAEEGGVERAAETDDPVYSVSPPPCCVPMPTSLLAAVTAPRKPPCAVEVVAGAGGAVDVGATDELRRLLRL